MIFIKIIKNNILLNLYCLNFIIKFLIPNLILIMIKYFYYVLKLLKLANKNK